MTSHTTATWFYDEYFVFKSSCRIYFHITMFLLVQQESQLKQLSNMLPSSGCEI